MGNALENMLLIIIPQTLEMPPIWYEVWVCECDDGVMVNSYWFSADTAAVAVDDAAFAVIVTFVVTACTHIKMRMYDTICMHIAHIAYARSFSLWLLLVKHGMPLYCQPPHALTVVFALVQLYNK